MFVDVGCLTGRQIDDEIAELVKLERSRDLTADGAFRLQELRRARELLSAVSRRYWL